MTIEQAGQFGDAAITDVALWCSEHPSPPPNPPIPPPGLPPSPPPSLPPSAPPGLCTNECNTAVAGATDGCDVCAKRFDPVTSGLRVKSTSADRVVIASLCRQDGVGRSDGLGLCKPGTDCDDCGVRVFCNPALGCPVECYYRALDDPLNGCLQNMLGSGVLSPAAAFEIWSESPFREV